MIILAILAGLLIGLSLGALGGGGSILTVPAMVYLLAMSAHQATGASLIVVGIASVVGAITHARAGRVALKDGTIFGVLGVAGAYLGSRASEAVPSKVLLAGFGVLMLVAAAAMIARQRRGAGAGPDPEPGPLVTFPKITILNETVPDAVHVPAPGAIAAAAPAAAAAGMGGRVPPAWSHTAVALADRPPAAEPATTGATAPAEPAGAPGHRRRGVRRALLVAAAATGVGLITGFFGVGGGFVIVPVLIMVLGFDMAMAAGTSLLVITIDSIASLATRIGHGALSLDWRVIAVFTGAAVAGAVAGGRLAGRLSPRRLSAAFIGLIIVLAVYTLARSGSGLL